MARSIVSGCGRRWRRAPFAADEPEGDDGEREVNHHSAGHGRRSDRHRGQATKAHSLQRGNKGMSPDMQPHHVGNAQYQSKCDPDDNAPANNCGGSPLQQAHRQPGKGCRRDAEENAGDVQGETVE